MFMETAGDIVTDDCAAMPGSRMPHTIPQHHESPAKLSKLQPPTSPRCDSGFSSGLGSCSDAVTPISPLPFVGANHGKIQYSRLDSGISEIESSVNSLQLDGDSSSIQHSPRRGCTANTAMVGMEEKIVKDEAGMVCMQSVPLPMDTRQYKGPAGTSTEQTEAPQISPEFEELYVADKDGDCQLHLAIASGFTEVVFALIRMAPHPAYLDIQNNELYAPLHIAVLMNQPNMVRRLIVAGATNDIRDLEGNTPLHLASKRGHLECAEALLRSISVDELKEACVNGTESHRNLHKILDTKNYQGEHSIHLATFGQHYNFIRFLCWSGADMNATEARSGKTSLHYAVNKRDLYLVALLATRKTLGGCEVHLNTRDWCGRTPMQCAAINGDTDIAALLSSQPGCEVATYQESDEDFEFDTDEEVPDMPSSSYSDIEVNGRVVQSSA